MTTRSLRDRLLSLLALSALLAPLTGCGGSKAYPAAQQPAMTAPAEHGDAEAAYPQATSQPAYPGQPAPPPAAPAGAAPRDWFPHKEEARAAPESRPGLATHWGESRRSLIRSASFERATPDRPSATAALWYNDAEGSRAMARAEGYRSYDRGAATLMQGGLTVSLRDDRGRALPGYYAGGKTFAIGEAGERYTIEISNSTPARFEVVVTVDGLDVIDGRPGSFDKRGYLVNPHSTLEIDGFRKSESEVAAFRFGSVRGSYAARKGDDRNVGVIGVAAFREQGVPEWPWDAREIERRRGADPFPGRFATPPPP